MNLSFTDALNRLGAGAAFRIANSARPPANFLFATLLPERNEYDFNIESGSMTVRTTMAGMVGMDSPYPPAGIVDTRTFAENTAKFALEVALPEGALRKLMQMLINLRLNNAPTVDAVQREALNFLNKVIVQGLQDVTEYLRAQALCYGSIDWTFNSKRLQVTYNVPAGNLLPTRTTASNTAYGGTSSAFWSDIYTAQSLLRFNVRAFILHSDTLYKIINNDVNNKLRILSQNGNVFTVQRYVGTTEAPSTDNRATVQLITYDDEAEIIDPANPLVSKLIPFMPRNKILAIGNNNRSGYRVGEGSTPDPRQDNALGYTHMAPTVEGGGAPGRWAQLFTPENQPWSLVGRGAQNMLPVIEAPEKIVVLTTE